MTTPAPLGRGLGRSLAFATVLGMVVFGITMVAVIYFVVLFPLTLMAQGVEYHLARSD